MDVVFTVHGVESQGLWQNQVHTEFGGILDFVHIPHPYGPYPAIDTISKTERGEAIEKFWVRYGDTRRRFGDVVPSVIAHSFGTYIVSRALVDFPLIQLDAVILLGSIVDSDYDWSAVRVRRVLNELAGEDPVVSMFRHGWMRKLIPFTGPSGVDGFSQRDPKLREQVYSRYRHSSYFIDAEHCRESWLPFIRRTERFRHICRECLVGEMSARRVFEEDYGPIVKYWADAFFGREPKEVRDAAEVMMRAHAVREGTTGRHDAEQTAQIVGMEIHKRVVGRRW
jgi:serine/threonine-protein kinase